MLIPFDFIEKLLDMQDIKVTLVNVNDGIIEIYAELNYSFAVCPKCGKLSNQLHDHRIQPYKHLDICGRKTILYISLRRFVCICDAEHPFTEHLPFIRRYQRQTIAYEMYLFQLCNKNTIKNVADITGLSQGKIQAIFNYYANKSIESKESVTPVYLGIDDIAVRKGHNYLTVIYNQATGAIVDIFQGRTTEIVTKAINKSFSVLERDSVKAVSIDMSKAFKGAITNCFPNADVVIDRFHLSQHLHNQVDKARKHIQNKVRKETGDKNKVFGIRWALLKNLEDLTADELSRLLDACEEYPELGHCLFLKEEFRKFFDIVTKDDADAFIDYFQGLVIEYDIPELKEFCKTLNNWRTGILSYYDHFITNGFVEGMNHKVKNIKRRAFNYRNDDNFKTRVLYECS